MATAMTGAQMLAACRKWGVDVHEYPGYTTRRAGAWGDAQGIMIHHVGSDASQSSSYLDFLFVGGRPDVPAPLCNVATQMDGDLWLGALGGRANHAGAGSSAVLNKVVSGNYDWLNATINPGGDDFNGNPHYYGNECCFDGGQPMTTAMWNSVVLWCAAICDFHGWGAWRVIGHKEHTGRKIDPGSTSMPALRRDVAAALSAGPGNWPTPQEAPLSSAEVQELKDYIDTVEGGRYAHIISTITQWSETKDNARQAELKALLADHQAAVADTLNQFQSAFAEFVRIEGVRYSRYEDLFRMAAEDRATISVADAQRDADQLTALNNLTDAIDALRVAFEAHAAPKA